MIQVIIKMLSVIIIAIGVVFIYDSRLLTKKFFGFGDQNEGATGLKILGFIATVVGGLIVFFVK